MSYIDVEVTQEDIELGERERPDSCAVARALRRQFPECDIEVLNFEAYVEDDKFDLTAYVLPKRATAWIARFDEGKTVKPAKFRLRKEE